MQQNLGRDQRQFEQWIKEYHAGLYRHALWMTGKSDVANDCVQEAYYQAWKSRRSLKEKSKVFPWLLTILRRTVYREYGQRSLDAKVLSDSLPDLHEKGETPNHGDMLDLLSAMGKLSAMHREIVLMHGLHGLSYQEISTILDIPTGTVMSRISRARAALEKALNDNQDTSKKGDVVKFRSVEKNRHE